MPADPIAPVSMDLDALLDLFGPVADQADPWPLHWIGNGGDQGDNYCRPCCKALAKHLRRTGKMPEADVDGGWDHRREADGPCYCHGCNRLLGYSLTRCGLDDEIGHWREDDGEDLLTPVQAYEIEAILRAAQEIGDAQDIADAIAIGMRLAPLLPSLTPEPSHAL